MINQWQITPLPGHSVVTCIDSDCPVANYISFNMLSYSQESYFDSHQSVTDIHRMMIVFYFSIVPSFFVYNLSVVSTSRLGVLTKVHRRINILSIHYTTILVSSVEWPATESWVSTFLLRQFRIGDRRSLVCHQKARKWRLCLRTTVCVKREKGKESKWQEVCLKRNGRRLIIINRPVARIWTRSMKTLMNIFLTNYRTACGKHINELRKQQRGGQ